MGAMDTAAGAQTQCTARGAFNITTVRIDEPNIHIRMQHAARLVLQHTGNAASAVICVHKGEKRKRGGTISLAKAAYACVYVAMPSVQNAQGTING